MQFLDNFSLISFFFFLTLDFYSQTPAASLTTHAECVCVKQAVRHHLVAYLLFYLHTPASGLKAKHTHLHSEKMSKWKRLDVDQIHVDETSRIPSQVWICTEKQ